MGNLKAVYENVGGLDQDMQKQHRDQTGSFYTPFEVALETVTIAAVRRLCHLYAADPVPVRRCLEQPGSDPTQAMLYFEAMCAWHVVDPAGGDGVFAVAWLSLLESLCHELGRDPQKVAEAAGRVHLFDLQPEPLAHYKDMIAAYFNFDPARLCTYTGNVLDTSALYRYASISQVMSGGGYDLVVGNPPYIGEKNHKDLFDEAKLYPFGLEHYEKNMDFFYYFIHLGMALLVKGGVMGLITTGYFFTADGASGLRKAMVQNGSFLDMARFEGGSLFKDAAGQSNVIFHFIRGFKAQCRYVEVSSRPKTLEAARRWRQSASFLLLDSNQITSRFGNFYFSMHPGEPAAVEDIEAACGGTFGDIFEVRQGIVSGFDRTQDEGVFVLTPEEALALGIETSLLVPFYKNSQVKRGKVDLDFRFWMLYIPQEIEDFETRFPSTYRHLSRFREKLSKRREVIKGIRPWYALQWPRTASLFEGPKIVVPHRALNNAFAFTDQPFYGSADLYYLTPMVKAVAPEGLKADRIGREDLLAVSLMLTTDLYEFWLSVRGKRKGDVLELYATPLRQMPLPSMEAGDGNYLKLKTLAADYYRHNGHLNDEALRADANTLIYNWLGVSEVSRKTIQDYFEIKRSAKTNQKKEGKV